MSDTPDNDLVICPNCVHQFRAIPVNVQRELAEAKADKERLDFLQGQEITRWVGYSNTTLGQETSWPVFAGVDLRKEIDRARQAAKEK